MMRAAAALSIRTIGIHAQQDCQALHRFEADESHLVGEGQKPLAAYFDGADNVVCHAVQQAASTCFARSTR